MRSVAWHGMAAVAIVTSVQYQVKDDRCVFVRARVCGGGGRFGLHEAGKLACWLAGGGGAPLLLQGPNHVHVSHRLIPWGPQCRDVPLPPHPPHPTTPPTTTPQPPRQHPLRRTCAMGNRRHAIPMQAPPTNFTRPVSLGGGVYVAGDHRDSATFDGAIKSGKRAAQALLAGA